METGSEAASLAAWLAAVTFEGLTGPQVTARLVEAVAQWGAGRGWRVYRRAASVLPLPPPLSDRHSVVDVACARPDGPPVVVEVDASDRGRTVEKLLAEAGAGRVPVWVRWSAGPIARPPAPVQLVAVEVTRSPGRLFSRRPARPAPEHSTGEGAGAEVALPLDELDR